ncbi:stage II sporulation protein D [Hydrogenibacillus schlegelii]|uniref:stage II sporulation protein D n=1 Tax=Hydrogenibacillus schlegelii TaxID=1484 RepID=UPI001470DD81|nr:stage II sporulation protein D [Hydrogenibacillus schlegelii]
MKESSAGKGAKRTQRAAMGRAVYGWLAVFAAAATFAFGAALEARPADAVVPPEGRPEAAVGPEGAAALGPGGRAGGARPAVDDAAEALERSAAVVVYRRAAERAERVSLRDYLIGVVAGEMPADFPPEALKAQAIAARTYVAWARAHPRRPLPGGAWVEDGEADQVYVDVGALRDRWKDAFPDRYRRVAEAVDATAGMILTYDDEPIFAAFFALSNGRTEEAGRYFSRPLPYLPSVPSPWDREAPDFVRVTTLEAPEVASRLGLPLSAVRTLRVAARTPAGYVAEVAAGRTTLTGRAVRERLGLRSASFDVDPGGGRITFVTYGHGHGVGLSQWGAKAMAEAGRTAEEILAHYYPGTRIVRTPVIWEKNV